MIMKSYPEPDNSYQHTVTETLNTALTNIIYYYTYIKENYVEPTIERISDTMPELPLWQWNNQNVSITVEQQKAIDEEKDYINWASVIDENYEELMDSIELQYPSQKK